MSKCLLSFGLLLVIAVSGCTGPLLESGAVPLPQLAPSIDCTFTTIDTTWFLDSDCTTTQTISIPDGFTLDGADHTVYAVDPPSGHFVGAVIMNEGSTAHVKNLTVKAEGLSNTCDAGASRLRGIMFEGASGSITHNTVLDINQGASGCQEGNAIEVRNEPFDGTHPNTKSVEISHNHIDDFQKTGIVANGDVIVSIHHNLIGDSATQQNLAANTIQFGFGAQGSAVQNNLEGNQWLGSSDWSATALLIYDADGIILDNNILGGNSDVGIYIFGDNCSVSNNKVFESGVDGDHGDIGIYVDDAGQNNTLNNNKIRGFDTPVTGAEQGTNKNIPGPQKP